MWEPCDGETCTVIQNPFTTNFFFEMSNCTLYCPGLKDQMVAQAYSGIDLTFEKLICGQLGVEYCKELPGQKKIELVGLKTMVHSQEQCGMAEISFFTKEDNTELGIKQDCDLSCGVRTNILQQCGTE